MWRSLPVFFWEAVPYPGGVYYGENRERKEKKKRPSGDGL